MKIMHYVTVCGKEHPSVHARARDTGAKSGTTYATVMTATIRIISIACLNMSEQSFIASFEKDQQLSTWHSTRVGSYPSKSAGVLAEWRWHLQAGSYGC
jgi:hypothetical protein